MVDLMITHYTRRPPITTASTRRSPELKGWRVHLQIGEQIGLGEAFWWPGFGCDPEQISADLEHSVSMMAGIDSAPKVLSQLSTYVVSSPARYALELACYDLMARQEGVSLASVLWHTPTQSVLVHRTLGSWADLLSMTSAPSVPIKLKVGLQSAREEQEMLRKILKRFPSIELRLDANGSWSTEHAKRMCALVTAEQHIIFEQPLAPDAMNELDALQQQTPAQIALDESFVLDPTSALDTQCRGVVIKPMFTGGLNAAREQAMASEDVGKVVCVTHALEGRIGRAGAQHFATGITGHAAHGVGFDGQSGLLEITQTPGHGVQQ